MAGAARSGQSARDAVMSETGASGYNMPGNPPQGFAC